ncbi:MAG TPA: methyltransferase, partial [Spirochaetia bacterium]|nr:methyltransferase [Spirochaetia bacterium]
MTPRQRVLQAFAHRQPERVPIDFSGHRSSGIAALAYTPLRRHLGLPVVPVRVYDPIQQLAVVNGDVLDRFGVDTVEMGRAFSHSVRDWQEWKLPDGSACLMPAWVKLERRSGEWVMKSRAGTVIGRMPDGALYFEQTHFPFMEGDDLSNLPRAFEECMWTSSDTAAPPGPAGSGPSGAQNLRSNAARLRATCGERAVVGLFGGNLLELGQFLYRNDNFFMLMAGEPEHAAAFLDKAVEVHLENLR